MHALSAIESVEGHADVVSVSECFVTEIQYCLGICSCDASMEPARVVHPDSCGSPPDFRIPRIDESTQLHSFLPDSCTRQ